jgi:hypothetical protein
LPSDFFTEIREEITTTDLRLTQPPPQQRLRKPSDFLQLFLDDFEFAVAGDQFRISCFANAAAKQSA